MTIVMCLLIEDRPIHREKVTAHTASKEHIHQRLADCAKNVNPAITPIVRKT